MPQIEKFLFVPKWDDNRLADVEENELVQYLQGTKHQETLVTEKSFLVQSNTTTVQTSVHGQNPNVCLFCNDKLDEQNTRKILLVFPGEHL